GPCRIDGTDGGEHMARIPAAEVHIDAALLRRLLADQHPDLAGAELSVAANGWDNVIIRIGPQLAARLPRRAAATDLISHEQQVLPRLAAQLPLPVRSEEHTSELQSRFDLVCRLLLEKKKTH